MQDLLARMTLQEKAGQMSTFSVGGLEGLFGNLPKDEVRAFMMRLGYRTRAEVHYA